jgi:hypothetical protein
MILQTDPRLNTEIATFGCYFMSCLAHAEKVGAMGVATDPGSILNIFGVAKGRPGNIDPSVMILGDECFVNDPVALLGLVGVHLTSVTKADKDAVSVAPGFELLKFHRDANVPAGMGNAAHDHFVLGDGAGNVAFDPLGESNTVKYGQLDSKRIFA